MSSSLRPHKLQHTRLLYPSLSPWVWSNLCPLSQWCHPTISSSIAPFSSCPQIFPSIRVFSNESVLHIRWPKYWSFCFSISPCNEYSGLISFRIDLFDLLTVEETQEPSPAPQFKSIDSSALSLLYCLHSYRYMTNGETTALTVWAFVCKEMSLLFNVLSRLSHPSFQAASVF